MRTSNGHGAVTFDRSIVAAKNKVPPSSCTTVTQRSAGRAAYDEMRFRTVDGLMRKSIDSNIVVP